MSGHGAMFMLALPCFKTPVPSQAGPQSVREMRRMRAITDDDDDDNGVCYALIYGVQWGRDPISAPFFFSLSSPSLRSTCWKLFLPEPKQKKEYREKHKKAFVTKYANNVTATYICT